MPKFNKKISDTEIRLGEVRFSYAHVFTPALNDKGEPDKYGCTLLIPKTETQMIKLVEDAIEAAKLKGKADKWGGKIPGGDKMNPLKDGDDVHPDKPEFEGMYFLNAKSKTKPGVRVLEDGMPSEPLDESEFYSGCWGAATISFYAYNHPQGGKGVGVGLGNVVKTRDDERFGGGRSADEDFGDLE